MKISEAMREGIKLKPVQGFGSLYPTDDSSCAMGAVYEGAGLAVSVSSNLIDIEAAEVKFPHMLTKKIACPVTPDASPCINLYTNIVVLNDDFKWTREKIADWLESIGE